MFHLRKNQLPGLSTTGTLVENGLKEKRNVQEISARGQG